MPITRSTRCTTALLAGATLLALVGCAPGEGEPVPDGPTTITMWSSSADTDAERNLYTAWEEASGNSIETVAIPANGFEDATLTRWATGDRPDILEFHPVRGFLAGLNPEENLLPLDGMPYIEQSDGLYDTVGSWKGSTYAAVLAAPTLFGMYYNQAALDDAGVEAPRTYEELREVCAAIQEKTPGVVPIYQAGGDAWPLTVLPFNLWGGSYSYAEDIAYNQAAFVADDSPFLEALDRFSELQEDGCYNDDIATGTVADSFAAVSAGEAAIVFNHSGSLADVQAAAGSPEAADLALRFGSVGTEEPYANFSPGPIGSYMAPKSGDTAREEAAKDFIEFATGEYYQTYVDDAGITPVIKAPGVEAPDDISELQRQINALFDDAPREPLFNSDIAGFGNFVQLMPQLAVGQLTPEEVGERMQAGVEQASRAAGVEGW